MHDQTLDRDALNAILEFHVEAGVDIALDETPHNRFAEASAPAAPSEPVPARAQSPAPELKQQPTPPPRPLPAIAALGPDEAVALAREQARTAPTLEALEEILEPVRWLRVEIQRPEPGVLRRQSAKPRHARGRSAGRRRGPGRQALRGAVRPIARPHARRHRPRPVAGLYRQRGAMASAGKSDADAAGDRHLHAFHRAPDRTGLLRSFSLCLGGPSAQNLLNTKEGILRTRGRWFTYRTSDGREIRTLPTLHPAYLLRQPLQKRLGWRDFQTLRRALDGRTDA